MLVSCLPDTGCTQSIISESLANQPGVSVDTNANIQLLTANGGSISVKGQAQLYLQHKSRTTITYAIVATGVSHPALISWRVISSSFPNALCSLVTPAQLRKNMLTKFPTVFRDTITEVPMNGKPVHIHMKPNAVPFQISVAQQIPLRFQELAEKSSFGFENNNQM